MANRRNVIIGAAAAAVVVAGGAAWYLLGNQPQTSSTAVGAGPAPAPGAQFDIAKLMTLPEGFKDHPIGPADAKVLMIEYLSPTCPHCATFHADVYPQLKAEYVDTGKMQFVPRPFVRNVLDAVVFLLAEAAGEARYHDVVDTFFKTQAQWAASDTPNDAMLKVAEQLGFTKESYDAALTNQALFTGLEAVRDQALKDFQLQGTPTFYLNGKMITGETTLEALKAEIDPLLA